MSYSGNGGNTFQSRRILVVLAACTLAGVAHADSLTQPGAIPRLKAELGGEIVHFPLEHTAVSAKIVGFVARVEVTQRYRTMDDPERL